MSLMLSQRPARYARAMDGPFERLGLVGAGVMGSEIAAHWLGLGYAVVVADASRERLDEVASRMDVVTTSSLTDLGGCELVLEAVYEDVDVKREVLRSLPEGPIVATNTSSLTVAALESARPDRSRFLAIHYNNPPATNPVVEVVPGESTDPAVLERCLDFVRATGKRAIRSRDEAGFALNRQSLPYLNEAARCHDEGLGGPGAIDRVARDVLGVGLGPFAVMNLVGTRVVAASVANLSHHGRLYTPAACLRNVGATNEPFDLDSEPAAHPGVAERLLGAVFVAAQEILERRLATPDELDFLATEALGYPTGPVSMMRRAGPEEVARLVAETRARVGC